MSIHDPATASLDLFGFEQLDHASRWNQSGGNPALEQWFTPHWAAERLIEQFFPNLGSNDLVLDPGCGAGAFLRAIPCHVPAIGVELDPRLAALAAEDTGREVICGDFRHLELNLRPTAVIGNPPWNGQDVHAFLSKAHGLLPDGGQCGFILPAHRLSYSGPLMAWAKQWSISQTLLPKSLFPRLTWPVVFAQFRKERVRTMVGFFLFEETESLKGTPANVRLLLVKGKRKVGLWRAVVEEVLSKAGRPASLGEIYSMVEGRKPKPIPTWRDTIRRVLQEGPFERLSDGRWTVSAATAA